MTQAKRTRGRPKGSGIDDTVYLMQIAAKLAIDPDLKPTTAIRQLGINNESTIRRLRDKFRLTQENSEIAIQQTARTSQPSHDRQPHLSAEPGVCALPLQSASDPILSKRFTPTLAAKGASQTNTAPNVPRRTHEMPRDTNLQRDAYTLGANMLAASFAAANFLAVQQAIMWHAGVSVRRRSSSAKL